MIIIVGALGWRSGALVNNTRFFLTWHPVLSLLDFQNIGLFSLILSVGMLVDLPIVVTESLIASRDVA